MVPRGGCQVPGMITLHYVMGTPLSLLPPLAEDPLGSSQPPAQGSSLWCRLHTKEMKVNKRWQGDNQCIKFITCFNVRVQTSKVIMRYQGYEARNVSKNKYKNHVNNRS